MYLKMNRTDLLAELEGIRHLEARLRLSTHGDDSVQLSALELETGLLWHSRCPATIITPGAAVVPAKLLYQRVRSMSGMEIAIKRNEYKLLVGLPTNDLWLEMETLSDDDTVPTPSTVPGRGVAIPHLAEMVALVQDIPLPRTYRKRSVPSYAHGALLEIRHEEARLVATDGHRVAIATVSVPNPLEPQSVFVLREALPVLRAFAHGEVVVQCGNDWTVFAQGVRRLVVPRVDDPRFPKYERVIPTTGRWHLEVPRKPLAAAIRRLRTTDKAIHMTIERHRLLVRTDTGHEQIPGDYAGCAFNICFQARYLLDFLTAVSTERVAIDITNAESPTLFQPIGSATAPTYCLVIMPMRVYA